MSGTLFPTIADQTGLRVQTPADLYAQLLAAVSALSPGYTARLPGSLIDDVSGTAVGALVMTDQSRVDTVASLTPRGANAWLLLQLGQIYLGQGSTAAPDTNTAVYVVFTGPAGFVIGVGFTLSDGTNQYTAQDGGIIPTGGVSQPLFCLATQPGSWAVPPNTVTQIVTSYPGAISLTVTNPLAGTPGGAAQTEAQYRAQVLQAGLASSQGMSRYLKTLLIQVVGVDPRLISVRAQNGGGWEVIVGGTGDPYEIGNAIYRSLFDISTLTGSVLAVTGITKANPGVVTTNLNHGFTTGQTGVEVNGAVGMTAVNGVPYTITVITEKTFSIGIDTTSFGTWTSGGLVTPNFRNVSASINDYPDTYVIPIVIPPAQAVTMVVTWNTISPNFVAPVGVAQLAQPALAAYINAIPVGAPINVFELEDAFAISIAGILPRVLLTRMVFAVSINGVSTAPASGTGAIYGDPESYFTTNAANIAVMQG